MVAVLNCFGIDWENATSSMLILLLPRRAVDRYGGKHHGWLASTDMPWVLLLPSTTLA